MRGLEILFDVEFGSAKVDEKAGFDARGGEIADDLRNVFVRDAATRFEFDNQTAFDEQVRKVRAEYESILVANSQRMLLKYVQPQLLQAMGEGILIDFFQMATPQVAMNGEARF